MYRLVYVTVGGAMGAALRYLVTGWVHKYASATFPWGTLTVNVLGCFALGLLGAVIAGPLLMREEYRLGIFVGFHHLLYFRLGDDDAGLGGSFGSGDGKCSLEQWSGFVRRVLRLPSGPESMGGLR